MKRLYALALAVLLTGCAIVPAPSGVTSGQLSVKRDVAFVGDPETVSSSRSAEGAVRKLLALQGYRIASKADVAVLVSFAERSPALTFEAGPSTGGTMAGTVRAERHGTRINLCEDRVYRLTVAFVDQRSGKVAYRGFSEQESCDQPSDDAVYTMAASAMRSLRRGD